MVSAGMELVKTQSYAWSAIGGFTKDVVATKVRLNGRELVKQTFCRCKMKCSKNCSCAKRNTKCTTRCLCTGQARYYARLQVNDETSDSDSE